MKKLTKAHWSKIQEALDACQEEGENVQKAIAAFNDATESIREHLSEAISNYNLRIEGLRNVYGEIAEEAQTYFDERSEKWQESDAGSDYQNWIDELESPNFEDIDIEIPDPIEEPDIPAFDDVSWLPADEPPT